MPTSSGLPAARSAGKLERLCRERSARDLRLAYGSRTPRDPRDTSHPAGLWFEAEAGDFAVRWIEKYCRHHKGEWAGQLFILGEWQRWNVRELFGWKRPDGTRRYRRAWWETPRKNGKTQIAGGIGLHLLVGDNEPGAEVYTTATRKEQAWICHEAARQMVRRSPELREIVKVPKNKLANLTCESLGSFMAILTADHGSLDGPMPHGDIRDEVHAWTAHELAEVLDTASGSRRQPLTLEITTAGVYDPEGVGTQHHEYAVDVLEGRIEDDSLFAFIAAAEEGDDPWDPATWWKANPNLGVSIKLDYMQDQARRARASASALNGFLTKLLDHWTNQQTAWLDSQRWAEAEDDGLTERDLEGMECVGGLDLSTRRDLTAFVLVFQLPDGGIVLVCRFWLPRSQIDDEARKSRRFYREWAERGWLIACEGDNVDYEAVEAEVNALGQRFRIREIGYDPANANMLAGKLSAAGFTMIERRQGPLTLSEPSKYLESEIYSRRVCATGAPGGPNPIMRWMVGNAVARRNVNGDIRPDKEKARGKIDGISASVTALVSVVGGEGGDSGSYLDSNDMVVIM
jgi:phage terminase large subunit-like protein